MPTTPTRGGAGSDVLRAHPRRSSAFEWAVAALLTAVAVVVLVGSLSVLVAVLVVKPHPPYLVVRGANIEMLTYEPYQYYQALLDAKLSLQVEARNDNIHSAATFSGLECRLAFAGATLAVLRADDGPFRVPARGALPLECVASVQRATLGAAGRATMEAAIRDGVLPFGVVGEAKTRWTVAGLVSITKWTRLACEIQFFLSNGTALAFTCTSKSKYPFF